MKTAGLGEESAVKLRLVWEKHDLPPNRRDLLTAVEQILKAGRTQKLVLEVGKPIRVSRLVPDGEAPEVPAELVDDDIYAAARNAEMGLVEKKTTPFEQLYQAFQDLSSKGARAKALLVPQYIQFFAWLKLPQTKKVFGVDVIEHKGIPDETALLVGAQPDDEEVVFYSARFELDVPSVRERYEADRRKDVEQRVGGQDNGKAPGAVGLSAGGSNGQGQRGPAQERNKGGARPVRGGTGR